MRTMMLAAATALALSGGVAYAASEGGPVANTYFTQLPGYLPQAPVQNAPAAAVNGQTVQTYTTQTSHGTWLFAPYEGGGPNS